MLARSSGSLLWIWFSDFVSCVFSWFVFCVLHHESLKAYLAPTGLVSEPRGDLTCRGDLRLEVLISVPSVATHLHLKFYPPTTYLEISL
jgi:hypothetical protein